MVSGKDVGVQTERVLTQSLKCLYLTPSLSDVRTDSSVSSLGVFLSSYVESVRLSHENWYHDVIYGSRGRGPKVGVIGQM